MYAYVKTMWQPTYSENDHLKLTEDIISCFLLNNVPKSSLVNNAAVMNGYTAFLTAQNNLNIDLINDANPKLLKKGTNDELYFNVNREPLEYKRFVKESWDVAWKTPSWGRILAILCYSKIIVNYEHQLQKFYYDLLINYLTDKDRYEWIKSNGTWNAFFKYCNNRNSHN